MHIKFFLIFSAACFMFLFNISEAFSMETAWTGCVVGPRGRSRTPSEDYANEPDMKLKTREGLFAVSESAGLAGGMEDANIVDLKQNFFGVFDGEFGRAVSEYLKEALLVNILRVFDGDPIVALQRGFAMTNYEILESQFRKYISAATTAWILGKKLFVANVGTSRAILCRSSWEIVVLSRDQRACIPEETEPIESLGGQVVRGMLNGIWYTSRAFGGAGNLLKILDPIPEIQVQEITDQDKFLVLASDGLWNVLSNEEVAQIVMDYGDNLAEASQVLTKRAIEEGSLDNTTVIVVNLQALINN